MIDTLYAIICTTNHPEVTTWFWLCGYLRGYCY